MADDTARLGPTLLKCALPLLGIGGALLVARRRGLSVRDDLGVRRPAAAPALLWLAAYAAWLLGTDRVLGWRGPWDFAPWARTPPAVAGLRVLAVGVLGPVAEELVFRGLAYARLARTRLGVPATVALLAAAWAGVHTAYRPGVVAVFFVAGLLLGAARYRTRTVVVPMLMHITWNLYAIW